MSEPTVNCLITHRSDLIIEVPGLTPGEAMAFGKAIEVDPEIRAEISELKSLVIRVVRDHLEKAGIGVGALHVWAHNAGGWRQSYREETRYK